MTHNSYLHANQQLLLQICHFVPVTIKDFSFLKIRLVSSRIILRSLIFPLSAKRIFETWTPSQHSFNLKIDSSWSRRYTRPEERQPTSISLKINLLLCIRLFQHTVWHCCWPHNQEPGLPKILYFLCSILGHRQLLLATTGENISLLMDSWSNLLLLYLRYFFFTHLFENFLKRIWKIIFTSNDLRCSW